MINIYELLKDKTEGIKLYCTLFGDVLVVPYKRESGFMVELSKGETLVHQIMDFDAFGRITETGECLIYPSKENRDWSKFKAPQPLPAKDELCWTRSAIGNWIPRYATGTTASNGMPIFFCNQSKKGESMTYIWRKWCDFEELINEK